MSLQYETKKINDFELVVLKGAINEDSELALNDLKSKLKGKISFDLSKIIGINSCGVRVWINFVRDLEKNNVNLTFLNCAPEVVIQINMIPSFSGNAKIESILGQLECSNCDYTKIHTFDHRQFEMWRTNRKIEKIQCPKCNKSDLDLDEIPDDYFSFLE